MEKLVAVEMVSDSYPNLTRLAAGSELWTHANDFDKLVRTTKDKASFEGRFNPICILWAEFSCSHFYVQLAFEKKTEEVAKGLLDAILANNLVVQLNLSRALVEHVASIAHQVECMKRAVDEIQKTQSPDKAQSVTERHFKVLDRLYYGGSLGLAKEKKIHVNDMLKSAATHWSEIGETYERMCEFVHPNFGSNLLVSSGELGRGQVGNVSHLAKDEIAFLAPSIETAASLCATLRLDSTGYLLRINQWVGLVADTAPNSLAEVFNVRTSTMGDGSSKENAISFKKARNHLEAVEAFYAWAAKQKIEIYKRKLVGVESGWLFDVAATSKGAIWVKYKMDPE